MAWIWSLGFDVGDKTSYDEETLVGTWETKLAYPWTEKEVSYDVCVWPRVNKSVLISPSGSSIIADIDGKLKSVIISKRPTKKGQELWWISFKLVEVFLDSSSPEKDDKGGHYTDI